MDRSVTSASPYSPKEPRNSNILAGEVFASALEEKVRILFVIHFPSLAISRMLPCRGKQVTDALKLVQIFFVYMELSLQAKEKPIFHPRALPRSSFQFAN